MKHLLLPLLLFLPLPAVAQNLCYAQALEASNALENHIFFQMRYNSVATRFFQMDKLGVKTGPFKEKHVCPAMRQLIVAMQETIRTSAASNICYAGLGVNLPGSKFYEDQMTTLRAQLAAALDSEAKICLAP